LVINGVDDGDNMPKRTSKEYQNFTKTVDRLLAVPRATLDERLKRYREHAAKNPNKRGPKPKTA
jgi:hypothetical protein